ncbi:MAG: hypothetical protein K0R14_1007 [Burkholderiales bacterium]|jgi:hypothetical protein|nr:hypothetical protein [Burkholderiales bacterium]
MNRKKLCFYGTALSCLSLFNISYAVTKGKVRTCHYTEYETVQSIYAPKNEASTPLGSGELSWYSEQQTDGSWKLYFKDSGNSFIKNMTTDIKNGFTIQANWSAERTYYIGSSSYYLPYLKKTQQYIDSAEPSGISKFDPEYVDITLKTLEYKGQYKINVIPESTKLVLFDFELKNEADKEYSSSYKYNIDMNARRAHESIEISNKNITYLQHKYLILENCNF